MTRQAKQGREMARSLQSFGALPLESNLVRLFLILIFLNGTLAFAGKNEGPSQPKGPCGGFLLGTPNSLPTERATPSDLAAWSQSPSATEFVQIFHDTENFFRRAPREVRDFLGMLPAISAPTRASVEELKSGYMVAELEVFFGVDVEQLEPFITALRGHVAFLSPESQVYLESITTNPGRLFVTALVLSDLTEGLNAQPAVDPYVRKSNSGLNWLPDSALLREPVASTRAFAKQFVETFYRLNRRSPSPPAFNANDNQGTASPSSQEGDQAKMMDWVADRIHTRQFRDDENAPKKWNRLLREAVEFLNTPVKRGSRIQDVAGVKILMSQLAPDAITVSEIHSDFERTITEALLQFYGDLLENAPVGDDRAVWNEQLMDFAFSEKYLASPWGVSVFAAMLNLSNPLFTGKSLPILAINALRRLVIRRLYEFYPTPALPEAETTATTHGQSLTVGPFFEDFYAFPFEEEPSQDNTPSNDNSPRLEPFSEETLPLSALEADTLYVTEFHRTNDRFIGDQRLIFTKKALDSMFDQMAKQIEPLLWIRAIREGMARSHGQNGIKILKQDRATHAKEGLKFEVKLLTTPWRLFGHFKNGIWYFEWFDNEHD